MNNRATHRLAAVLAAFALCVSGARAADVTNAPVSTNAPASTNIPPSTNAAAPSDPVATIDASSTSAPVDALQLRNGDKLFGKLLAIDSPNVIRWQHPDSSQPIEFKPETVGQIDFAPQHLSANRSDLACKVHLADGNLLAGSLVSCNLESLVLDTWYAGRLTIARGAIHSLSVSSPATTEFDGITTIDGWTQGNTAAAFAGESGQWIYRNGAFYSDKPASIARNLGLPDSAQIEFDLTWKGALNLAIALYTDSLQPILLSNKENGPEFGGFYSLQIQSVFMQLRRIKKKEPLGQSSLGDLVVPSLSQSNRIHMDLRCSKAQHCVALLIDGLLIKQWIDPNGFAGEGKGMRFVENPPGGAVKISNLRISHWDGVLEQNRPAETDPAHDTAWLGDGTALTGTLESIADGKLTVQTGKEKVEAPLSRLREVEFAQARAQAANTPPVSLQITPGPDAAATFRWQPPPPGKLSSWSAGNTRASFAQGGILIFQLDGWTPDGVMAHSPIFGKAKFNPAAFVRFQFLQPDTTQKPAANGAE